MWELCEHNLIGRKITLYMHVLVELRTPNTPFIYVKSKIVAIWLFACMNLKPSPIIDSVDH
jgi:hypothetical protein